MDRFRTLREMVDNSGIYIGITLVISIFYIVIDILAMLALPALLSVTLYPDTGSPFSALGYVVPQNTQTLFIFVTALFLIRGIFVVLSSYTNVRLSYRIRRQLSLRLAQNYLYCDFETIANKPLSEITTTLNRYCDILAHDVVFPAITICINFLVALAIILFIGFLDFKAVVVMSLVLALSMVIYHQIFNAKSVSYSNDIKVSVANYQREIAYGFGGPREIRLWQFQERSLLRMRAALEQYADAKSGIAAIQSVPRAAAELLAIFLALAYMLYKNSTVESGAEVLAPMAVFAFAGLRLIACFSQILSHLTVYQSGSAVIEKLIEELEKYKSAKKPKPNDASPISFEKLVIQSLSFRHSKAQENILHELNLSVSKGESIGIVGESGAGKSTLADVILGLLEPSSATVLVNSVPTEFSSTHWQEIVGFVPQTPFLADDSLVNNIAFGIDEQDIDHQQIDRAIELACLRKVLDQLPDGLLTQIGEGGAKLSGGQRQRVAIARALYFGRELLILDEVTSALDEKTEAEIVETLTELRGKVTIIVIAHRLSTLNTCDVIYELKDGKLTAQGTRFIPQALQESDTH